MALRPNKPIDWAALKADTKSPVDELPGNKASPGSIFQSDKLYCNYSRYTSQANSFSLTQCSTVSTPRRLLKCLERAQMTQGSCHMFLGPELVWQFQRNLPLAPGQPGSCLLVLFESYNSWPGPDVALNGNSLLSPEVTRCPQKAARTTLTAQALLPFHF